MSFLDQLFPGILNHFLKGLVASDEEVEVLCDLMRPVDRPGCPSLSEWREDFARIVESAGVPHMPEQLFSPQDYCGGSFSEFKTSPLVRVDKAAGKEYRTPTALGRLTANNAGYFLSELMRRIVTRKPEMRLSPAQKALRDGIFKHREGTLSELERKNLERLLQIPGSYHGDPVTSPAAFLPSVALVLRDTASQDLVESEIVYHLNNGRIVLAIYGLSDAKDELFSKHVGKPYFFRQLFLPTGVAFAPEVPYVVDAHAAACGATTELGDSGLLPESAFPDGCFAPPAIDALMKGEPFLMAAYLWLVASYESHDPYFTRLTYGILDSFLQWDWPVAPALSTIISRDKNKNLTPLSYIVLRQGCTEPNKLSLSQQASFVTDAFAGFFRNVRYDSDLTLDPSVRISGPAVFFPHVEPDNIVRSVLHQTQYRAFYVPLTSAFPIKLQTHEARKIPYYYKFDAATHYSTNQDTPMRKFVESSLLRYCQSYQEPLNLDEVSNTLKQVFRESIIKSLETGEPLNPVPGSETPPILRAVHEIDLISQLLGVTGDGVLGRFNAPLEDITTNLKGYVTPYRKNNFRTVSTLFVPQYKSSKDFWDKWITEDEFRFLRNSGNLDILMYS